MEQKDRRRKLFVKLKQKEQQKIFKILKKGINSARVIRRALILELFDRGYTSNKVSQILGITSKAARDIGWKYIKYGLEKAINEPSRPGKPRALNERQANMVIALVCSEPPQGKSRWTLNLIKEEVIKSKIVSTVSRETIRVLLKSHDLKPWREKNVDYS